MRILRFIGQTILVIFGLAIGLMAFGMFMSIPAGPLEHEGDVYRANHPNGWPQLSAAYKDENGKYHPPEWKPQAAYVPAPYHEADTGPVDFNK